ncbi:Hypothetical predicted protein [Lecanosticta acicola]|uniref:NADP-dependent oxidoreductase domain-containing protein n=1 Tax=Lecanosticta acicola TaxID=111012 RepID=A0AAI8YZ95_9PEZI|nr:Hypothetical predicted protein [Lecanosticta acicola]
MATCKAAKIPALIYGTAWKKDETRWLVAQALINGFRGVDTAAQPKHYQEHLVGAGIRDALQQQQQQTPNLIKRQDLYIQTKFTSLQGQDPHNLPYNPNASIPDQIHASIASSLENLHHTPNPKEESYIDCLLLHSPLPTLAQTAEAWKTLESYVPRQIRTLGLSNVYHLPLLEAIHTLAEIKPSVLQNRFCRDSAYDPAIRAFCRENRIRYESFWTLTANPHLLTSDPVGALASSVGIGRAVALYGLVLGLGNVSVLDGTKNVQRMREDTDGVEAIRTWKAKNTGEYASLQKAFEDLLLL